MASPPVLADCGYEKYIYMAQKWFFGGACKDCLHKIISAVMNENLLPNFLLERAICTETYDLQAYVYVKKISATP